MIDARDSKPRVSVVRPGQRTDDDGDAGGAEIETLKLQVLHLRDELIGAEAKLGELRARVERLQARSKRTEDLCELRMAHVENELAIGAMNERQVEMMLSSTTWRVGRAVVSPAFALKRALQRP
jgi:hypothetical protein